jgi:polyribonucleotide nucleotidyltransferase
MSHSVQIDIHGQPFSIETGKVAKQADGAVVVRFGASMVLATVVGAKSAREGQDFFPLTVEYRERAYAGGRIPGGYFKREGAPVKKEILTCRRSTGRSYALPRGLSQRDPGHLPGDLR